MRLIGARGAITLCTAATLLAGCATSTQLSADWKDQNFTRVPLTGIMVIGVARDMSVRQRYELEVVSQLEDRGVRSVASHLVLPVDAEPTRETIKAAIDSNGLDSVLITELVEVRTDAELVPGQTEVVAQQYYSSMYNYYYTVNEEIKTPDTVKEHEIAVLENRVFDAASEQMIWSAITETKDPRGDGSAAKEIGKVLIDSLARHGLI
jgi:hypothetical protein